MGEQGIFTIIMSNYGFVVNEGGFVQKIPPLPQLPAVVAKCSSELESALYSLLSYKPSGDMSRLLPFDPEAMIFSFSSVHEAFAHYSIAAEKKGLACSMASKAAYFIGDSNVRESYLHYILGKSYNKLEKHKPAIRELEKSILAHPNNIHARVLLGMSHNSVGNIAAAEEELKEALSISSCECKVPQPEGISFICNKELAKFYAMNSYFREAAEFFERCIRMKPKEPVLYVNAAQCYEGLGNYDEALQCLRYGIMRCPENAALKIIEGKLIMKRRP